MEYDHDHNYCKPSTSNGPVEEEEKLVIISKI